MDDNKDIKISKNWGRFIIICLLVTLLGMMSCERPKVYRVGILSGLSLFAEITDGLKIKMTEMGYIEGKNISYDIEESEFDMQAYDRILKKFIDNQVDLIVTFPTEASQQAKSILEGSKIPLVFVSAFTEDTGLINSIQEPGGNITGIRWPGPEIVDRGFKIGQEMTPQLKRVIVCYTKGYPVVKKQLEVIHSDALAANISVVEIPASNAAELTSEFQKIPGPFEGNFIHMIADPILVSPSGFAAAATFASMNKIPMGGAPIFQGDYQSVYALIPDSISQGKQAAYLIDKIIKGSKPGKLPVLTADINFIINYNQAEKLNLNLSDELLSQADQVIR